MHNAFTANVDGVRQITNPRTVAVSISEGLVSNLALQALRCSGGDVCTVSEAEISQAANSLSRSGLVAEASSCVSVAAANKYLNANDINPDARVVAILTATGLRWPSQMPFGDQPPVMAGAGSEVGIPLTHLVA